VTSAAPPVVPGYTLEALLGRGGSGEVWRAVPRGGGAAVAVKVLVTGDPERQAREAALLGELDHPHLVRLHEVVHQPTRGGTPRVALVLDLLEGGSLAALLARRGRLRPGEVVTAIAPVATALAHTHGRGVVHGDLSPGNIVFTAEGRPVLTDLGVARVLGETAGGEVTPAYVDPTVARGGAPGPASDVFGLAAAAFHALTGVAPWNAARPADVLEIAAAGVLPDLDELAPEAPAGLRATIARGLAADPADRGSAGALALDLRAACRPEPVRLPGAGIPDADLGRTGRGPRTELTHQVRRSTPSAPGGSEPSWWRRAAAAVRAVPVPARLGRRAGVLLALLAVLAAVVWVGGHWGAAEPASRPAAVERTAEPPARTPATPSDSAGWRRVVAELYDRRAQAFRTGAAALLGEVYVPGSPALAADVQAMGRFTAAHHEVRGFAPEVSRIDRATASGDTVELSLADRLPPYQVVDGDGVVVAAIPGRGEQGVRMTLVRTGARWRIGSVARSG
jgi:hypothetical protein